jgi:hypothetical protein
MRWALACEVRTSAAEAATTKDPLNAALKRCSTHFYPTHFYLTHFYLTSVVPS